MIAARRRRFFPSPPGGGGGEGAAVQASLPLPPLPGGEGEKSFRSSPWGRDWGWGSRLSSLPRLQAPHEVLASALPSGRLVSIRT